MDHVIKKISYNVYVYFQYINNLLLFSLGEKNPDPSFYHLHSLVEIRPCSGFNLLKRILKSSKGAFIISPFYRTLEKKHNPLTWTNLNPLGWLLG